MLKSDRDMKGLHSFKLKHQLEAQEDCVELVIAQVRVGSAKVGPSVHVVSHQLDIVAVDVLVEAAVDGLDAVVALLSGV